MGCITSKDKPIKLQDNPTDNIIKRHTINVNKYKKTNVLPTLKTKREKPPNRTENLLNKKNNISFYTRLIKRKTVKRGKIVEETLKNFILDRTLFILENNSDPYEKYSVVKCLGEGSFGKVYKVFEKQTK